MADPGKPYLKPGKNRIKIVFSSPLKYIEQYRYGENREISYTPCGAMKGNQLIRKAHSMFGWDWGAPASRCRDFPGYLPGMPDGKDNSGGLRPAASPWRKRRSNLADKGYAVSWENQAGRAEA